MKNLKLTILVPPGESKADLKNAFGDFKEINMTNRYVQFNFPSVKMLTPMQLKPICDLLNTYERNKDMRFDFKMFHLSDEATLNHSPTSIQCRRGHWYIVNTNSDDIKSAPSMYGLF